MARRVLTFIAAFLPLAAAAGNTIDTSPCPAFLLSNGGFLTQSGPGRMTRYDRFGAARKAYVASRIASVALSSDERLLLLAGADGSLSMFDVATGRTLWMSSPPETGLGYIYDVSFAWDARSLVAAGDTGRALIIDASTGKKLADLGFLPRQTSIMSACLSPDGSHGYFLELEGRLFEFDTATGEMADTGLEAGWAGVRYSAGGDFILFGGVREAASLQVVKVEGLSPTQSMGPFTSVGLIRPTPDGGFQITATKGNRREGTEVVVGLVCEPLQKRVRHAWSVPYRAPADIDADFDTTRMAGISTDFRLVTTVFDLRTNEFLLRIDESANYEPTYMSWSYSGNPPVPIITLVSGAAAVVVILIGYLAVRRLSQRRRPGLIR